MHSTPGPHSKDHSLLAPCGRTHQLRRTVQGATLALMYVMYLSARNIGGFSEKSGSPEGILLTCTRQCASCTASWPHTAYAVSLSLLVAAVSRAFAPPTSAK